MADNPAIHYPRSVADVPGLPGALGVSDLSGNSIVLFGDSITSNNGPTLSGTYYSFSAVGYFVWANILLGQPFRVLANLGVGGEDTAEMTPRLPTVLAYEPDYCMVLAGTNDVNTTTDSAATIISRLTTIYSTLLGAGIKVIASTIPPTSYATGDRLLVLHAVNAWIRTYSQSARGMLFADMGQAIVDATTGAPRTGMTDGSHPYQTGAFLMGKALADALRGYIKPVQPFGSNNADATCLNPNPMMLGDAAGLATGWTGGAYSEMTYSKEARTDGCPGEWQKFVSSARKTGTDFAFAQGLISTGFAVDETVYAQCEIAVEGCTDLRRLFFQVKAVNAAYADVLAAASPYAADALADLDVAAFTGVIRTPDLLIPANTKYLRLGFYWNGVGTVKIGRIEIRKV